MTIVETESIVSGIRLRYEEREYTLSEVAGLLERVDGVWRASHFFAETWQLLERVRQTGDTQLLLAWALASDEPPSPDVGSLVMASPLDLQLLASHFADSLTVGGVGWYTIHLVRKALQDPKRIAEWLPTLVMSWRQAWTGATVAKAERQAVDQFVANMDDAVAKMLQAGALERATVGLVSVDSRPPGELYEEDEVAELSDFKTKPRFANTYLQNLLAVEKPFVFGEALDVEGEEPGAGTVGF